MRLSDNREAYFAASRSIRDLDLPGFKNLAGLAKITSA
jgi:hypothetical protein